MYLRQPSLVKEGPSLIISPGPPSPKDRWTQPMVRVVPWAAAAATKQVATWINGTFYSQGMPGTKGQAVFSRLPSTIHTLGLETRKQKKMLMFHNGPGFPKGSNFYEPTSGINSTWNNMTSVTLGCLTWASCLNKQLLLPAVRRVRRVYHSILDGRHNIAVLPRTRARFLPWIFRSSCQCNVCSDEQWCAAMCSVSMHPLCPQAHGDSWSQWSLASLRKALELLRLPSTSLS